jgi:hypothetical protein
MKMGMNLLSVVCRPQVHKIFCVVGKIRAHKFVLSLVSDVFRAQFSPRFSDSNQGKMPPNLLPVQAGGYKKMSSSVSLLTNSALVIRVQMRGGGGGSCGVSADGYSCAHHVTWSPNKLWRSTSIFNLWVQGLVYRRYRTNVEK